jgi:hypothetical protein
MKQRVLSASIAIICLGGVGAAAWWGFQQRTSPGPLHPSHVNVSALQGNKGCTACHGSGDIAAGDSLASACMDCHSLIADQLKHLTGIHGSMDTAQMNRCEACHHEHLGDAMPLVSDVAFRLAGIVDWELYNHSHVPKYELNGAHERLACVKCHQIADAEVVKQGEHRFLGFSQVCTACHEDSHKGELGTKCAECHGQEKPFKDSPLFKHPESFPLKDGHSVRKCSECHTTPQLFTGLSLDCNSCHDDDYAKTTQPPHVVAGMDSNCIACHGTVKWKLTTFTHSLDFPLIGGHADVACASCHAEGEKQRKVMNYVSKPTCVACHVSPHEPGFVEIASKSSADAADTCASCHQSGDTLWSASIERLTPEQHAATGYPLTPPHDKQKCAECHPGLLPGHVRSADAILWKVRFPGRAPDACERCHEDPHLGQFKNTPAQGACASCHQMTRFYPTNFDAHRHGECKFPLDGGHLAVACGECHKLEGEVRKFVGTTGVCADCHEDVHKGAFDKDSMPRLVHDRGGCARCHTTSDFQKVDWTSDDHGVWTEQTLSGKHATAACNDCHRRDQQPGQPLTTLTKATKVCSACHQDSHARQFEVNSVTDCARCHKSNDQFKTIIFDHDKDSRFPLDVDHRNLECNACHKPVAVEGKQIVRYKPLGVLCADCHDSRPQLGTSGARKP